MRKLLILLFLPLLSVGQIKNYYDMKNISGTTLTDSKGGNNGTITVVSSNPVTKTNGYLNFTGGNGNTVGDYGRVEFTLSDYQWTKDNDFSYVLIVRTTKDDAVGHTFFYCGTTAAPTYYHQFFTGTSESSSAYYFSGTGSYLLTPTTKAINTGKWVVIVYTYTASGTSAVVYNDNIAYSLTLTGSLSGNFYSAGSKAILGAKYNNGSTLWSQNLTGDICRFINYTGVMPVGKIADVSNEFELLY